MKALKPKELVLRIGFESASDEVRNKVLGKGIPNPEIERVANFRKTLREGRVRFLGYVLFGMKGISERSVIESVKRFNKILNGVIAIKYRRYREGMPKEVAPSEKLLKFLRHNCLDVDMADSPIWDLEMR